MTELIKRCICRRSQLKTRCERSHIRHPRDMRLPPTVVSLPNALQGDRVFDRRFGKKEFILSMPGGTERALAVISC